MSASGHFAFALVRSQSLFVGSEGRRVRKKNLQAGDRHNDACPTEPKESFVAFTDPQKSARDNAVNFTKHEGPLFRGFSAEQG